MFGREPLSNRNDGCQDRCDVISKEVARMETWLAVDLLNVRHDARAGIGLMLSTCDQSLGALRASARGL